MSDSSGKPSIFVLGSYVVACSAHVVRFPSAGETATARRMVVEVGGKGFNLAAACHRLGANVYSIFAIGEDAFAETAAPAFARAGFTPTCLRRCSAPTGSGVAFIDATGETCLAVHSGANQSLDASDVAAVSHAIGSADITLAQFEIGDPPIIAAFADARRHGRKTILNPSPFRRAPPDMLRDTSMIVVNETEAAALADALGTLPTQPGQPLHAATAAAVFAAGPQVLVVTLGARGAIAHRVDGPPLVQAAFPVTAVDALGAGDAFLAAFATDLALGRDFAASLRTAAAAGAFATLRPGVFDALATREELHVILSRSDDSGLGTSAV